MSLDDDDTVRVFGVAYPAGDKSVDKRNDFFLSDKEVDAAVHKLVGKPVLLEHGTAANGKTVGRVMRAGKDSAGRLVVDLAVSKKASPEVAHAIARAKLGGMNLSLGQKYKIHKDTLDVISKDISEVSIVQHPALKDTQIFWVAERTPSKKEFSPLHVSGPHKFTPKVHAQRDGTSEKTNTPSSTPLAPVSRMSSSDAAAAAAAGAGAAAAAPDAPAAKRAKLDDPAAPGDVPPHVENPVTATPKPSDEEAALAAEIKSLGADTIKSLLKKVDELVAANKQQAETKMLLEAQLQTTEAGAKVLENRNRKEVAEKVSSALPLIEKYYADLGQKIPSDLIELLKASPTVPTGVLPVVSALAEVSTVAFAQSANTIRSMQAKLDEARRSQAELKARAEAAERSVEKSQVLDRIKSLDPVPSASKNLAPAASQAAAAASYNAAQAAGAGAGAGTPVYMPFSIGAPEELRGNIGGRYNFAPAPFELDNFSVNLLKTLEKAPMPEYNKTFAPPGLTGLNFPKPASGVRESAPGLFVMTANEEVSYNSRPTPIAMSYNLQNN